MCNTTLNKSGLCFNFLNMIVDFLAMETTLEVIFIVPYFQRVFLSVIQSYVSQVIDSGSHGSKQIYQ
jgi:hypothetical protein